MTYFNETRYSANLETNFSLFYLKNSKKWRNKSVDLQQCSQKQYDDHCNMVSRSHVPVSSLHVLANRSSANGILVSMVCIDENRFVRTLSDAAQHQLKIVMACTDFQNSLKHCPEISKCRKNDPKRKQKMSTDISWASKCAKCRAALESVICFMNFTKFSLHKVKN
ncbi:hypothetical protein T03_8450 [Trichinella britovi]|uniref:Uncharacterized protein n=1 Tax=Trichinella britovi TaxID=45882 RepID=A0A0V1CR10_TRIBR|nr:hypothetical protein T03_8450 [Trichinella britovi]